MPPVGSIDVTGTANRWIIKKSFLNYFREGFFLFNFCHGGLDPPSHDVR
jgi:hypothetical protein